MDGVVKKVALFISAICLMFCLAGCGHSTTGMRLGRFVKIPNEKYLYYDINTKVVYFINYGSDTASMMSPYYASNGEVYLYTEGGLEECK